MPDPERERVGAFVVTSAKNLSAEGIICAQCQKLLTTFDAVSDSHTPSPERLLSCGAVAIPNFGWFCSQVCAVAYETTFNVRFRRDVAGKITYYDTPSQ